MCATCGCGDAEVRVDGQTGAHLHVHEDGTVHAHGPDHAHPHATARARAVAPSAPRTHTIDLETAVLAKNDELADANRAWMAERNIAAVNLMSSPGAGKTSLLERTIRENGAGRPILVVEGDQETAYDAERIRAIGARAVQINTGSGCHLDATMVRSGLDALQPSAGDLVVMENVGNLVCPALFDLGENRKVVIISVTEGDDKPLKYPHMFAAADLVVVNKIDLLPYVDFDVAECESAARRLNPTLEWMPMSARTGDGVAAWYRWLGAL